MARLFIVGAGGFGREVFAWMKQMPEWETRWDFAGFLDDNHAALDGFSSGARVVAGISGFAPRAGDEMVCAIGAPEVRLRIARELQAAGAVFPIIRHPLSAVGDNCRLGAGTILCPGAMLTSNVTLGDFVIVNLGATVGHDARVGDAAILSPHADVTGFAVVEACVMLGAHAVVLPSARVGRGAKVGAGSVVLRSVPAGATVFGVPAKQILP